MMLPFAMLDIENARTFGSNYAGGGTFWNNKSEWFAHAPGFNLDRVRTPLLITSSFGIEPGDALAGGDLEFYVGLRVNQIPTDYLLFPDGPHPLVRPKQRFASLTATLDWMSFWLQGYEDTAAAKKEQYARWEGLRTQQDALLAREKAWGQSVVPLPPLHR
jgi:hypothetical protein